MNGRATLSEGPVGRQLLRLGGPMVFGLLSIILLNVIDTWFISKLGTAELAAISFTFPVVMLIGSVAIGLGVGATSVISRAIGAGDERRVKRLATDAMMLAVLVVAVLSTVGYFTIDPLFRLLGASDETLPMVRQYMSIWYIGVVFVVVPMVGNSAIRATGDTRTPALTMLVAAAVNLALDPLLIFGIGPFPELGIQGAAIATVIARAVTLLVSLAVLHFREQLIEWRQPPLREAARSWWSLLAVGLPAAATQLGVPLTIGILTAMIATHGEHAVAAYGAGSRVETLLLLAPMALASGLSPFVGQNWGAGRRDRLARALVLSGRFVAGWGVFSWALLALLSGLIAQQFAKDDAVVGLLGMYLWIVPLGHAATGYLGVASATFNAQGQPLKAAALALLRTPVLTVALCLLGNHLAGVPGIFVGLLVTNLLAGVAARVWLHPLIHPPASGPQPTPEAAAG
jgi:MATE family, multidrug efflux pump